MPKALTKNEYAKFIIAQLGGTIVDIELEQDVETFIDMSLIQLKPYMNTTKLMTLPMSGVIDLTGKGVYTVVHVFRGSASSVPSLTGNNSTTNSGIMDGNVTGSDSTTLGDGSTQLTLSHDGSWSSDSYLFNPNIFNYYGLLNGTSTTDSIAITMLTTQIINTVAGGSSSDIDFYQDGDLLYVDVKGGDSEITIQYLPDYQSVEEVTEPFWINYILNLAVARTKIALGRARSKYTGSNLPYELDGDTILNEGITELETLTSELKENHDIWYILD